jgi:hypothetical protein
MVGGDQCRQRAVLPPLPRSPPAHARLAVTFTDSESGEEAQHKARRHKKGKKQPAKLPDLVRRAGSRARPQRTAQQAATPPQRHGRA